MPTTLHIPRSLHRPLYAVAALALLGAAIAVAVAEDTGWWQLGVFVIAPDIALIAGVGPGLERGQLHPRAVPLYNALHRFVGPLVLAALALAGLLGAGWLVGALAWGFHVAVDRAIGYGLRTREGFQRA
jgi:uncharacterized protein DUF4260